MVPFDLLRRVYIGLSASSEAHYRLRCEFAISHAQLCISHYILGIGDRHLSNFMIDLQTGAMVGIDFGHAFGSATQFLPVPELVPFRLTRQLRNVMLPLQEKGLMEGVMIHCLQALRSQAELLLTTMDVFIKEPSLDWKKFAEKQKQTMQLLPGDSDVDNSWYPLEKVGFARRKLKGDNCAHIMRDELRLGHSKKPYCQYTEKVLMGDRSDNIRTKHPPSGLTTEQQVACLIDLATDPNVLGRFWVGWEPWM
jgi:DNA-dependent protein kinase catalytic subunit